MSDSPPTITIRPAYPDDQLALVRLASLDSANRVPPPPLMLAEVDGELRAALSLRDGSVIADPFALTERLVALLRTHAGEVEQQARGERHRLARRLRARYV